MYIVCIVSCTFDTIDKRVHCPTNPHCRRDSIDWSFVDNATWSCPKQNQRCSDTCFFHDIDGPPHCHSAPVVVAAAVVVVHHIVVVVVVWHDRNLPRRGLHVLTTPQSKEQWHGHALLTNTKIQSRPVDERCRVWSLLPSAIKVPSMSKMIPNALLSGWIRPFSMLFLVVAWFPSMILFPFFWSLGFFPPMGYDANVCFFWHCWIKHEGRYATGDLGRD